MDRTETLAWGCTYLVQQDGEGVQEVIVAALKDVHNTDQAAAHVPPHLNLCTSNNVLKCPVYDLSGLAADCNHAWQQGHVQSKILSCAYEDDC